jgi:hypothetical protein
MEARYCVSLMHRRITEWEKIMSRLSRFCIASLITLLGFSLMATPAAGFISAPDQGKGTVAPVAEAPAAHVPDNAGIAPTSTVEVLACTACPYLNRATSRCIDDSFEFGLRAFPCNGLNYQKWYNSSGAVPFALKNAHTGRCIDDSVEFGLRAFPCNGLKYQRWHLNQRVILGTTYFHLGNAMTGRFLDDSVQFGLRSFPGNNLDYQLFTAQ